MENKLKISFISIILHILICVSCLLLTLFIFNPVDTEKLPYEPNYLVFMIMLAFPLALSINLFVRHLLIGIQISSKVKKLFWIVFASLLPALFWALICEKLIIETVNKDYPGLWLWLYYRGSDVLNYDVSPFIYFVIVFFIATFSQLYYLKKQILTQRSVRTMQLLGGTLLTIVSSSFFYLLLSVLVLLPYFFGSIKGEDYIVPETYQGCFRVIYNVKDGIVPDIIDGRLQINVPKNGIVKLKTKLRRKGFTLGTFSLWKKQINHNYYIVNKNGSKEKLVMTVNENGEGIYHTMVEYKGYRITEENKKTYYSFYKRFEVQKNEFQENATKKMRDDFYTDCFRLDSISQLVHHKK